jgi:hypothetical protein
VKDSKAIFQSISQNALDKPSATPHTGSIGIEKSNSSTSQNKKVYSEQGLYHRHKPLVLRGFHLKYKSQLGK